MNTNQGDIASPAYLVWVNDNQVTRHPIGYDKAEALADQWRANGYDAFVEQVQ